MDIHLKFECPKRPNHVNCSICMKHSVGLALRTRTQSLERVGIAYSNTSHELNAIDCLDFEELLGEAVQIS